MAVEYIVTGGPSDSPKNAYVRVGKKGEWGGTNGARLWAALNFWDEPRLFRLESVPPDVLGEWDDWTDQVMSAPNGAEWVDVLHEQEYSRRITGAAHAYSNYVSDLCDWAVEEDND